MSGQRTQVVVVGGAVAGCSAALALRRVGAEVVICEAHPVSGTDLGAFLTLAGNGMQALAQIGAAEPVARAGFELTSLNLLDEDGGERARRPMGDPDDPLLRSRCLRWSELTAALQAEVRARGIELRLGAGLVGAVRTDAGIRVDLADGSRLTADLLVGADGLNSAVRPLVDPEAPAPRYIGQRVFYGYTDRADPPTAPGMVTMVRGSAVSVGYLVSPAGQTFWFARQTAPALEQTSRVPAPLRAELLDLLHRDRTPAAAIVEATDELLVTNARDLPGLTTWTRQRAVLVGDAAHAASPATGQGASMAFEDAVVLAKAVREAGTEVGPTLYERLRRPRTDRNMLASAAMSVPPPRPGEPGPQIPPAPFSDEELARQLDWPAPLPTPPKLVPPKPIQPQPTGPQPVE